MAGSFRGDHTAKLYNAAMAYIRQIPEDEATGKVARVYEAAGARAGGVANILKVMSLDGRSLEGSMGIYVSLMKSENALDAPRRALTAALNARLGTMLVPYGDAQERETVAANQERSESMSDAERETVRRISRSSAVT